MLMAIPPARANRDPNRQWAVSGRGQRRNKLERVLRVGESCSHVAIDEIFEAEVGSSQQGRGRFSRLAMVIGSIRRGRWPAAGECNGRGAQRADRHHGPAWADAYS